MQGVILKGIDEIESKKILRDMHEGVCGGHYMAKTIAPNVLRSGFWWPTLFKDTHEFVKKCDACQKFGGKLKFSRSLPCRHHFNNGELTSLVKFQTIQVVDIPGF